MTVHSLFMSPLHFAWSDNVDDPALSKFCSRFLGEENYNILYHKIEQYELDNTATRAISFANYTRSEWSYIICRVVGSARLNTAGKDSDGSTSISGKLPVYGTALFPGVLILSSYNVDTFTIESLADDTTVELYAAIAAEDDDTRMDLNA